jgi:hypothetical protein
MHASTKQRPSLYEQLEALPEGLTGEILDLNGGAHLKRYPNIQQHLDKLMEQ